MSPDPGRPIRVRTGAMSYGPHAVARHEGKVLFVRGAAPDERVEVLVREERPRHAFADLLAVVEPSPERRAAPCRYLPRCGGCPWQHLDYAAQLAHKRRIVAEQLRRIAGLDVPVAPPLPAPSELGGRRRIKLRVESGAVGYYAGASHDLVPIDECLLAAPAVARAIVPATALVLALPLPVRRIELIAAGEEGEAVVAAAEVEGKWDARAAAPARAWLAEQEMVAGLVLSGRGWQHRWGDTTIRFLPEPDLVLTAHAPVFTQVNPAVNRALVAQVVAWADPGPGQRVLDLYAGAGNLSVPLHRRGAAVVAVEADRQAAADAAANAAATSGGTVEVRHGPAERELEALVRAGAAFDTVVLDPPRSGAAGCIEALGRMRPRRIIYVACDPATLARDLARLAATYRVEAVQPFDMFPQTYHVETAVLLTLPCDSENAGVSSAWRRDPARPSARPRLRRR